MKKVLVAVAIAAFAVTAKAEIKNSSHDLSLSNTTLNNYPGGTLSSCQYCHAPHNVNAGGGAPLWNRTLGYAEAGNMYTSGTVTGGAVLGANSLTCLSCHDGVSDMGSTYTGSSGFAVATPMALYFSGTTKPVAVGLPGAAGSNGLTDDHPVGLPLPVGATYKTAAAATAAGARLYAGRVECGSCHEPHGTPPGGTAIAGADSDGAPGGASFLRIDAGTICDACHSK